ncbi:TPA: type IV secretion protein Dot [Legionella pneumophila]|nr:type IV secretion protein Dot [Legionella pneumophila]
MVDFDKPISKNDILTSLLIIADLNKPSLNQTISWEQALESFLSLNDPLIKTEIFIKWLSQLNPDELQSSTEISLLLKHLAEQKLLPYTLKKILIQQENFTTSQINWLCDHCLIVAPDQTTLPDIIKLSSWSWLENHMKRNELLNFDLLKIAILNKDYLASINHTKESQLDFIYALNANKFNYQQILELIALAQDSQIKSLLITCLLSKKEYLDNLKGESFLAHLSQSEFHSPPRLNALIHQLNLNCLTVGQIELLQPEACVTLLCSIPHFHQLSEKQVEKILLKYPKPDMIAYWLHHYSSRPNAHFILAHLMNLVDVHVVDELNKMDPTKKESIIMNMVEHLELFDPTHPLLINQNEEKRLISAIQRYLYGQHHDAYVTYIKLLVYKLLSRNYQFSPQAMQLLICLNNLEEFKELNNKIAYLTNYYLRASAQSGDSSLFYNDSRINITSMTQLVQLAAKFPTKSKEKSLLSSLFCGIKLSETSVITPTNDIPEHPLVNKLIKSKRTVKSIDYFLMHFKGDKQLLSRIINDYLAYYVQEGCTEMHRRSIYHLIVLMSLSDISASVREAIFTAFLNYPELHDEQINFSLFVYDAKKTIRHFGAQASEDSYTRIIDLCEGALKKLNPNRHKEIISIATQALTEAKLELSFGENTGFIAQLITRVKRCWYYGWTGFFFPNPPAFVAISDTPIKQNEKKELSSLQQRKYFTTKLETNLSIILDDIKSGYTQQKLNELIEALNIFSLQHNPKNELKIRQKLHRLFHYLLLESKSDLTLDAWLLKNQQLLITNRFRLLEMLLMKGARNEAESLLKEFDEDSTHFSSISKEFTHSLPEQNPFKSESVSANQTPAATILDTANELATSLKSTLGNLGVFFSNNIMAAIYPNNKSTPQSTTTMISP